ncbi:prepilin-type N-terminal cleavage/methylation domain [Polynucleobacter duraquae]|uniref:Type II secretion system protein H n=1 Tax=Polynucleobacter duraquae TaxID=1835254 RepID=A0A0E3ZIP5_9BURK|nr:GspH/FimT family pseudopilin [Polynucleobacter duraquae]AKD24612.1 prepilin-type N-terminal cleavage/methylation domain [Polynucleobacter duraquae]
MTKPILPHESIGARTLNKHDQGHSLLELMAVVLIISIIAISTLPLLHEQMAAREIDIIARRFIAHAQFARAQALLLGAPVRITPLNGGLWDEGWVVKNVCDERQPQLSCTERHWISQGDLVQVYFKGGGKQFTDPHTSKRGILFNAAGAAKTAQGGFVANRLILGHDRDSELERQLILGSGGRWRICDPHKDSKACK